MEQQSANANTRPRPADPLSLSGAPAPAELAALFAVVRTERLGLRRPTGADAPAMFAIHGDPSTNRYNPHGPDPDFATSEEVLRQWLRQWDDDGFGYWAVTLAIDPTVIGFGGVRRITWHDRDILNLYYRLAPAAWGHGYATETARAAVELARSHLPALPIVARVRSVNIPSVLTAERAGLVRRSDLDT